MYAPMEYDCLKPAQLPHTTRLYSDYLAWRGRPPKSNRVAEFYEHAPTLAGVRAAAGELKHGMAKYPASMRAEVGDILRTQNMALYGGALPAAVERNLAALASGAAAIVTGQQVGLFGGPAYALYKALSALRIASELSKRGVRAVPIFWMASEDHDLAEVNHVEWLADKGRERLDWKGTAQNEGGSVGRITFGAEITQILERADDSLGGAASGEIAEILRNAYLPERTFSSAFANLMSALLGERGLLIFDPIDARVSRLAAPLYRRAIEQQQEITKSLLEQNKRIEKAGYHAQVKVTERSSLLFRNIGGKRVAIARKNSGFVAGGVEICGPDLAEAISQHPEEFSANALLRPVLQDTLLPTVAYIGGPAEIAYFAQNRVVYEKLLGRTPAFLPRASFTLIESGVERLLKKYQLSVDDVFRGRQHLRLKMETQNLPRGLAARFTTERKNLEKMLAGMKKPIGKVDATLAGALETASKKMLFQFDKLRAKTGRAEAFRAGVLDRHELALRDALYPENALQERSLSLLPFLARDGMDLLADLEEKAGIDAAPHCLIRL